MAIGEAGSLQANTTSAGQAVQVTFDEPLDDPIIALTGTNLGGNKYSLRVLEVQTDGDGNATGFTFTFDEWENHDGPHPAVETINWLAVEEGTHILPDGRLIEAGRAGADSDGESVNFAHDFNAPPVVLTTVASNNDASNVDSDPAAITSDGFTLSVEEAESQDGIHGIEQVGWIAIEPGSGTDSGSASNSGTVDSDWETVDLGDDFTAPIILAETQTKNDPDPGNVIIRGIDAADDEVDIRFEEDTSVDGDRDHAPETVGLVTFEDGLILCFTAGTTIATPRGPINVEALEVGDWVMTRDNGLQQIRWCCAATLPADDLAEAPHMAPVLIPKDAFGRDLPSRDTLVSPQHRLLVKTPQVQLYFNETEALAPAKALFDPAPAQKSVTYVHILLDRHEIVFANDLPMESFHPGDMSEAALSDLARAELFALFPQLRATPTVWGPTARTVLRMRDASVLSL